MVIVRKVSLVVVLCVLGVWCGTTYGAEFKIGIMQDDKDAVARYKPVESYLAKKGIEITYLEMPNYSTAASMFNSGKVDGMFSGSGLAGIFIMRDLAVPVVRPVLKDGVNTYHAVILAPKGAPKYTGNWEYFKGKTIAFTALASAGEIFYRSIPNIKLAQATIYKVASHGAAIDALAKGSIDVAIVKNHVWNRQKSKYPNIELAGEDLEENPDSTLIVSKKADANTVSQVSSALLGLKDDKSSEANLVREEMGIKGYIKTVNKDFEHTFQLLQRSGADSPSFNFYFQ